MNYKVLNSVFLLLAGAVSSGAYAACIPDRGFSTVDVSMAVGRVVVRPSDAVGKVLKKRPFQSNRMGQPIVVAVLVRLRQFILKIIH